MKKIQLIHWNPVTIISNINIDPRIFIIATWAKAPRNCSYHHIVLDKWTPGVSWTRILASSIQYSGTYLTIKQFITIMITWITNVKVNIIHFRTLQLIGVDNFSIWCTSPATKFNFGTIDKPFAWLQWRQCYWLNISINGKIILKQNHSNIM